MISASSSIFRGRPVLPAGARPGAGELWPATANCRTFRNQVFAPAKAAPLASLAVFPSEINLTTARDRQSIVVQATFADGITRDVTREATLALADPKLVQARRGGLLSRGRRRHDAVGQLRRQDGHRAGEGCAGDGPAAAELPAGRDAGVHAGRLQYRKLPRGGARQGRVPDLALRLRPRGRPLPADARDGRPANQSGRAGREHAAREGDRRRSPHRRQAIRADERALSDAAQAGSRPARSTTMRPRFRPSWASTSIPSSAVLDGKGSTQQLTVRARYSDGTDRDVTSLAVFLTNNDVSAPVSTDGLVTAGERGEAFVMARFETHTVGSQFIVLPQGLNFTFPRTSPRPTTSTSWSTTSSRSCGSPRRASATTRHSCAGRRSTSSACRRPSEEYKRFMKSTDPAKRSKWIDELLERKEFSEIWVSKWAELLQVRTDSTRNVSQKAMFLYYNWLVDKLSKNMPMDEMVQELLGASGGTFKNAATNFYQITNETLPLTENVAQVFMGIRVQCAQCHNHPFDRWTQNDYYSFAAFFAQIGRKQAEDYRETIIFNSGGGEVTHPVGGRVMPPKFLGGEAPDVHGKDRRVVLAKWLASSRNPWFATSFANRVWAHFMGVGIVEPVDDFRVSNPASNPELLEALGKHFTETKYNLKALVRDICNSRTYQRSTQRNESNAGDERNFAHALVRRIKAENLLDTISAVTNTKDKFDGLPVGARAVQIADGTRSTYFLKTFGRATRETPCSCEVKMEPTLVAGPAPA